MGWVTLATLGPDIKKSDALKIVSHAFVSFMKQCILYMFLFHLDEHDSVKAWTCVLMSDVTAHYFPIL